MNPKPTVLLTALALAAWGTAALAAAPPEVHRLDREVRWARPAIQGQVLEVKVIEGDITVQLAEGSLIEVVATRTSGQRSDIAVQIVERGNRLTLCTVYPEAGAPAGECAYGNEGHLRGKASPARVDFDIRLPRGLALVARTVNGGVKIADLSGTVEARSVTGDVILDRGASQKVYASSVSGNVQVSELQPQQIEARTTSGSIVFVGRLGKGPHRFESYSGDISLRVPESSDAALSVRAPSGNFTTSLETRKPQAKADGRFSLALGDESNPASVEVSTYSGDIRVDPLEK